MKNLALFVGRIVLFLSSMALITGLSLFVVGGFLMTWPILRLSPRSARTKSLMQLAVAIMGTVNAYGASIDSMKNDTGDSA